ncbi:ECF transporter S component [Clostridium ganghwense]|uniref:ECF transporter S component n=1 Tax=Clostridium ganghwense TaxID=312089 RepID=A0ABT4CLZ1_9CLOT|nr:ECF transporter S component [Clostridium ganghwense]MCY6370058.1 ECF transporter S component [Clostridium ganghwense]
MNSQIRNLVRSSLLLAIAVIFQMTLKHTVVVGPVVNAVLLLTTFICGTVWGIYVGLLTPLLAFATGTLNAALGPFVPFIMIGNAILVFFFGIFKGKEKFGKYLGLVIGSLLKYLFLYVSATKLVSLFKLGIPAKLVKQLAIIMGIPQFYHALIGGAFAILIIELLKKRKQIE